MNIEQFVVFLSHNSRDKPAVEFIKGLLERGDLERGERTIPLVRQGRSAFQGNVDVTA